MKYAFALVALWFGAPAEGRPVKETLQIIHTELQELAIDLPFDRVHEEWREQVRENYKTALRELAAAVQETSRNVRTAADKLERSLSLFRQVGLLLPFADVDKTKVDQVMSRFLGAEDNLRSAYQVLTSAEPGPDPEPVISVWRHQGVAWAPLGSRLTHGEALRRCRALPTRQAKGWRLPNFAELAGAFRAMKNPRLNPVFGDVASRWDEVWTGEPYGVDGDYYYLSFIRERSGSAAPDLDLAAVCIGR